MALCKLEGRITIPTGGYQITVNEGGGDITGTVIAAGNYYLSSATNLLTTIAAGIEALTGTAGTYTLTLEDDTGKVTIAATGVASIALSWPDTALRSLLGFGAGQTLSGSLSYQSSGSSTAVWLPSTTRSNPPTPDGHVGQTQTDGTITMAPSGQTKALKFASRGATSLLFRYLPGNKVWTAHESVTNESWETFWTAYVAKGYPVRYHTDRATDGTYVTWRLMNIGTPMISPEIPNFTGTTSTAAPATLWAVGEIDCAELVT